MRLAGLPIDAFVVCIDEQPDVHRLFGRWRIGLTHSGTTMHVARHTTRASAEKHAKALRAALRGET